MVVVSKAGECPELRTEFAEHLRDGRNVLLFVRHVIAGQQEHVGLETVGDLDGSLDVVEVRKWTVMDVGKMDDLEPVKFLRQPLKLDLNSLQRKAARLVNRRLRDLRDIAGKIPQGPFGRYERIYALGDAGASLSGRFHLSFE